MCSLSGDSSYGDVDNSDEDSNLSFFLWLSVVKVVSIVLRSDKLEAGDGRLEAENMTKKGKKRRSKHEAWKKNNKIYKNTGENISISLLLIIHSQLGKELCNSIVQAVTELNVLQKLIINRERQYLKIMAA